MRPAYPRSRRWPLRRLLQCSGLSLCHPLRRRPRRAALPRSRSRTLRLLWASFSLSPSCSARIASTLARSRDSCTSLRAADTARRVLRCFQRACKTLSRRRARRRLRKRRRRRIRSQSCSSRRVCRRVTRMSLARRDRSSRGRLCTSPIVRPSTSCVNASMRSLAMCSRRSRRRRLPSCAGWRPRLRVPMRDSGCC